MARHLDTLLFTQTLADRTPRTLAFSAKTREEADVWQRTLRRKLIDLLGGFPRVKCPLDADIVETRRFQAYTRETVLFQSREGLTVYGYMLLPHGGTRPLPTLICCPGHGRGCDDIVGINEDGTMRATWGGYQQDFALQAVYHGFAVFAIEQLGFGHRRDARARDAGPGASSCMPASGAALLLGQTMVGWRVYDVIRTVDYLKTRAEVDPRRIGCMGISGGGTTTLFATAVDPRIQTAMISGYFNSFRASIASIPHCIDNYVPRLLEHAEMSDLAGLIAPRPLFVESGTRDPIFPIEATHTAVEEARAIYAVFGASDRVAMEVFEDEHTFYGRQAFPFLKRWMVENKVPGSKFQA